MSGDRVLRTPAWVNCAALAHLHTVSIDLPEKARAAKGLVETMNTTTGFLQLIQGGSIYQAFICTR